MGIKITDFNFCHLRFHLLRGRAQATPPDLTKLMLVVKFQCMFTPAVSAANAVARFFIEIAAVVALGICVSPLVAVAAVIAWALFAAPKAKFQIEPLRLGTQAVVLLGAAAAVATAAPVLGAAFAAIVILNSALIATLPAPEWAA
jgi:hypothetical protein